MLTMWVSLMESAICRSKVSDVKQQRRLGQDYRENSYASEKDYSQKDLSYPLKATIGHPVVYRQCNTHGQFHELIIGDPSRNIVEMIIQKAIVNTSKPPRKIKTVLRINNSKQVLERFEKYREMIKRTANEQCIRHPRSIVDGNEVLRFYSTTIIICQGKSKHIGHLCKDIFCGVCRIIEFISQEEQTKDGILMCTSRNEFGLINRTNSSKKKIKNLKSAIIVCRTISGSVGHDVASKCKKFSSEEGEGLQFNFEKLVRRNPSAVLPCFVVVFS